MRMSAAGGSGLANKSTDLDIVPLVIVAAISE